jgi:hypothetical protein
MSTMTDAAALLARQDALQAQAAAILRDIDLLGVIGAVGTPVQTGSAALGLMVARDIDVTTLCARLDVGSVFDLGRVLAGHPRVGRLSFRNDTGRWNTSPDYPDGLYWQVEYVGDDVTTWNLDLWFIEEGSTQFDLEHIKTLPHRLTPETRLVILAIKEELIAETPRIASYLVYDAVLEHGARTIDDVRRHIERA